MSRARPAFPIAVAVLGTVLALGSGPVAGQTRTGSSASRRVTSRTPWGDPDLQGIWPSRNSEERSFQRLTDVGEAAVLQELIEAGLVERIRTDGTGEPAWARAEVAKWLQQHTGTASLVVDPPDGRVPPFTPDGAARAARSWHSSWGTGPWESASDLGPFDRCISRGLPGSMLPWTDTHGMEIVQSPGIVAIRTEMIHETRIIPLDGRPHVSPALRGYMGDSRGHWEGDVLVVDSTNFNGRIGARLNGDEAPTSLALHTVERFTPLDPFTLHYQLTIDDPGTWTRPWSVAYILQRTSSYVISEYACHEGNYGLANILSAARAADRAVR